MATKKKKGQSTGVLGDIWGAIETGANAFGEGTKELGQDVWDVTAADKPGEAVAKKLGIVDPSPEKDPAKKKKPSDSTESATTALDQLGQYLANNYVMQGEEAVGQMGQQLAQQNAALTSVVGKYIGGGGVNSGSSAVNAAMSAYQNAYSAGEGLNSAAYQNMGTANEKYLESSPLYPILNLLTQGLGSDQYKQLPSNIVDNLPVSLQYALSQAGVTVTGGAPISPPKGGWPKSVTSGSGVSAGLLQPVFNPGQLGAAGAIPTGTTPTPGNPATPGQ
jgi:hypothetical protein